MSFNLIEFAQTITAAGARGGVGRQAGALCTIVAPATWEARVL